MLSKAGGIQLVNIMCLPFTLLKVDSGVRIKASMTSTRNGANACDIQMHFGLVLVLHRAVLIAFRNLSDR